MKLRVFIPTRILLEEEVAAITAEGRDGGFGLRPNHIDFVAALAPGLLGYRRSAGGQEHYLAVDRGVLVKRGAEVMVSVRNAVAEAPLEKLAQVVAERFSESDERQRQVQTAVARLEADFLRRFMEI